MEETYPLLSHLPDSKKRVWLVDDESQRVVHAASSPTDLRSRMLAHRIRDNISSHTSLEPPTAASRGTRVDHMVQPGPLRDRFNVYGDKYLTTLRAKEGGRDKTFLIGSTSSMLG
jgi:hypothetical protein